MNEYIRKANDYLNKKNYVDAARCYQQYLDSIGSVIGYLFADYNEYKEAENGLKQIISHSDASSADLNKIGCMYYNGEDILENKKQAKIWFEKAIKKGSVAARRNLGFYHEHSNTSDRLLWSAGHDYVLAIMHGYLDAQVDLDRLVNRSDIKGFDLFWIGYAYFSYAPFPERSKKAMPFFESAIRYGNIQAHIYLGEDHERNRNFYLAVKHYRLAMIKGYKDQERTQARINKIYNREDIPAGESCKIGSMYHDGDDDGIVQDIERAITWYKKAQRNGSESAYQNLLLLRKHLKKSDFKRVLETKSIKTITTGASLEDPGESNETVLQLAAENKLLKTYARLTYFGANIAATNSEGKTPRAYLSNAEQIRENRLRNRISSLVSELTLTAPQVILKKMKVYDATLDERAISATLDNLYQREMIRPLMDLAKLAILGLHDLSRREKFTNPDYDSDDDDQEKLQEDQFLSIYVDANRPTVEHLYHYDEIGTKNGLGGKKALGVYPEGSNTLYFGGNAVNVLGTFIHELTHFVAEEVFRNNCNPYEKTDELSETSFNKIKEDLRNKKIDSIVRCAFLYSDARISSEIIVRTFEILVIYPYDVGLKKMNEQMPELLNFVRDNFLPAVIKHTKKLEQRALSDWPIELFEERRTQRFSM